MPGVKGVRGCRRLWEGRDGFHRPADPSRGISGYPCDFRRRIHNAADRTNNPASSKAPVSDNVGTGCTGDGGTTAHANVVKVKSPPSIVPPVPLFAVTWK